MAEVEKEPAEEQRGWFHRSRSGGGGIDFARLIELAIPLVITAAVVMWTNAQVTSNQVSELKQSNVYSENQRQALQRDMQEAQNRLIELNAKVTAYLGQQTQINSNLDARLTYIERAQRAAGNYEQRQRN